MKQGNVKSKLGDLYPYFEREYSSITNMILDEHLWPSATDTSWYCTCGHENQISDKQCKNCGITITVLAKILKKDYLEKKKNENRQELDGQIKKHPEAEESLAKPLIVESDNNEDEAHENEKKKHRIKKPFIIVASAVMLLAVAFVIFFVNHNSHYSTVCRLINEDLEHNIDLSNKPDEYKIGHILYNEKEQAYFLDLVWTNGSADSVCIKLEDKKVGYKSVYDKKQQAFKLIKSISDDRYEIQSAAKEAADYPYVSAIFWEYNILSNGLGEWEQVYGDDK